MRTISWTSSCGLLLTAVLTLVAGGCVQGDRAKAPSNTRTAAAKGGAESSKHDSWWCDEHGIPEAECSMCSKKVADACKAQGDWCELHNRAKSQCFKCDPKLKEVFAAKYRAKYGKEPPPIEDD